MAEDSLEDGPPTGQAPFKNANDLYEQLDAIPFGDNPWQSFKVSYSGPLPKNPPL